MTIIEADINKRTRAKITPPSGDSFYITTKGKNELTITAAEKRQKFHGQLAPNIVVAQHELKFTIS